MRSIVLMVKAWDVKPKEQANRTIGSISQSLSLYVPAASGVCITSMTRVYKQMPYYITKLVLQRRTGLTRVKVK